MNLSAAATIMDMTKNVPSVPRVLVVEDEPDIAALIAYQLTREGFRVETAANGNEALGAVGREVPDLVVLDRMLPGLSNVKHWLREHGYDPDDEDLCRRVFDAAKHTDHTLSKEELEALCRGV